jgi:ribosome biogenesis GTPase
MLVDKLLIYANKLNVSTLLVINKSDIADEKFVSKITNEYENVVDDIIKVSAKQGKGINNLVSKLENNFNVFAGQSAVGKSTILNAINPELKLETGELSKKASKGKHTTRHTQIYKLKNNTLIADTPGFSLLDIFKVEPQKLKYYYTDINAFNNECKYRACNHINILEKDCAVKRAVTTNKLNEERYNRYVTHYNQIKKRWDTRYD